MFEQLEFAPADPILGLNEAFRADVRSDKINLGVGVYKDEAGQTPVLKCVKLAETQILENETSKGYLGIDGLPAYCDLVRGLLFGTEHSVISSDRARSAQAPGGTGALRIAADFLANNFSGKRVWISNPTWVNHRGIFESAGLVVQEYRYYDAANRSLDFAGLLHDLDQLSADDVVILHGCCHNPTGVDPSFEQWQQLAQSAKTKGWLPLFDFAYQGFAKDVDSDAAGLRHFAEQVDNLLVASSFSKNFGLYNERIGALTVVASSSDGAARALSQIKRAIRTNYSNPPSHGAQVVATILADPTLKAMWLDELAQMCQRIHRMRQAFVAGLSAAGVAGDFGFIEQQNGMFSFSGLSKAQVEALKADFAIYIVGSGRINVAGMTESNLPKLIEAIAAVS